MRVQWKQREIIVTLFIVVVFSTFGLLKFSGQLELQDRIKREFSANNGNTFKLYEEEVTEANNKPSLHKKVHRSGIYQWNQRLHGSLLDKRGIVGNVTSNITSELVFSFSPTAERHFLEKLVDPNHEQKVYANSPAMIWDGEKFVVVMRMWLDKEHTYKKTKNIFSDNYLYMRTYNEKMEALDVSGRVLGIPTRVLESIGDGPIEPRTFPFYDQLYLSFNAASYVGKREVDTTMFWDWDKDKFVMPKITDGQPQFKRKISMPRDKHWSPYEFNGNSYMVYSFDPLRIITCNQSAECKFFQNAAPPSYQFHDFVDCVRGGTPTVQYKGDFYISITHTTLFKPKDKRYYTINLVVLKANATSKHKIVYFSEPINFHKALMEKTPMVRTMWIDDAFFFPVSLLVEDEDNIIIGGHINDHSAYLFRMQGIKAIMEQVMREERSLHEDGPANGVLHKLSRDYSIHQSGYKFS